MTKKIKMPLMFEDISKFKAEIYGISILWIMLFHAHPMFKVHYTLGTTFLKPLDAFIGYGNMGVEIFLFCSGIFLYFSYHRKPDAYVFITKRITRLFWPCLIISFVYWFYTCIMVKDSLLLFVSKATMLDFWISGDQQIWFVAAILVFYLLYPYIYGFMFQGKGKLSNPLLRMIVLVLAAMLITMVLKYIYPQYYDKIEIGFTRFPVFIIGCYFGKLVYDKKTLPRYMYPIFLFITILAFVVLELGVFKGVWRRWFYLVGGIPMTFVIVWILNFLHCKPLNKFFAFFGGISLNLYISHVAVIRMYNLFFDTRRLYIYLILIAVSVLVGWVAELIIKQILKFSKPKQKSIKT